MTTTGANAFQSAELADMVAQARAGDGYAGKVLGSDLLSVGLYLLPEGGTDHQSPHNEDEVYYAVSGRAKLRVGEEDHRVQPGTVMFVPALAVHFFHDIEEELVVVVFWAPPERSVQPKRRPRS